MTSLPRFSVRNPVLVSLMTVTILVGGIYSGLTLVREMFPEFEPRRVQINAVYPGATPSEIERGIAIKLEEAIKTIDEIDETLTTIGEGYCRIVLVLYNDVKDLDQVVDDVKAAIDTIPREDFPEDAEEVRVAKLETKLPVIQVAYYGDLEERALKTLGERIRDDLLDIDGISDVVLQGTRDDEISVEVAPEQLIKYGLSLPQITEAIRQENLDLPGGQLRTELANVAVRSLGEKNRALPIGDIIIKADPTGRIVRLNEIANLVDGFADTDVLGRFNAKPGVGITVFKSGTQDAIDIARKVKAYVAGKSRKPLERDWMSRLKLKLGITDAVEEIYRDALNDPFQLGGELTTATNLARFIEGRLDLLKRNGFWGLIFVFGSLLFFLNWRVAFWVMAGLLLAILGTLICMKILGSSLNLMTMFGLIVVLGLLVDDAIIIGEHIYSRIEGGQDPKLAAIEGAETVTWPVVCAIATTIVAFLPLLFIEGTIGDFMGILPVIVMVSLTVSLFEALSILPSHLAEWLSTPRRETKRALANFQGRLMGAGQALRRKALEEFMLPAYGRLLKLAVAYRYVTMSVLLGTLVVSIGFVAGGRVPFVFFPKMDSETLSANIELSVGAPLDETDRAVRVIEAAAMALPELQSLYTIIGVQYDQQGGTAGQASHLGQLIIELSPIEQRDRESEAILRELREKSSDIAGVNSIRFASVQGGPGGAPIQVEISGDDTESLVDVATEIKTRLEDYTGVFDIDDDFDTGRREVQIEVLNSARAIGLTMESLATQVRGAFYGLEARKVQRGREDVKIMVRYPKAHCRHIADIEHMWIAAPSGEMVPFCEVARITDGRSYATIKRKNQKRTVTVTADVDDAVANARMINQELGALFPDIERRHPGIKLTFGGQTREFQKSFGSLKRDFLMAAGLIYVLLAAMFKSYLQPMIVMTAIPFGIIGAIAGHWLMGYPLTILSLIGLVALTGIVVNDSLILVDWINGRLRAGLDPSEAVVDASLKRLRPILLTSITTVLGLAPLMFETSFQARFLIPMGISIAGGVAFATVVTLIAVPSLYLILIDAKYVFRAVLRFAGFAPESEGQSIAGSQDAVPLH